MFLATGKAVIDAKKACICAHERGRGLGDFLLPKLTLTQNMYIDVFVFVSFVYADH